MNALSPALRPDARAIGAAHRLLALRGVDASLEALAAACGEDGSGGRIASALTERGCPSRVVRVGEADLAALPLPTLLFLRDGEAAVLLDIGRRTATLDSGEGAPRRVRRAELAAAMTGLALDLSPAMAPSRGVVRTLASLVHAQRAALRYAVVVGLVGTILGLLGPLVSRVAMDGALPEGARSLLAVVALGTVVAAAYSAIVGWLRERALIVVELRTKASLAAGLFERTLALPFRALQERGLGSQLQTLASGEVVAQSAVGDVVLPLVDGAFSLVHLAFLVVIAPSAAAIVVAVSAVSVVGAALVARGLEALQAAELEAQASQQSLLFETLSGAQTIKACAVETRAVARWLGRLLDARLAAFARRRAGTLWRTLTCSLEQLGIIAVVMVCGRACLGGALTLGTLLAAIQLASTVLAGSARVAGVALVVGSLRGHLARVGELLEASPGGEPLRAAAPTLVRPASDVAVRVEDVWFRHGPTQPWVLERHALTVRWGEHAELWSASGTGKTTLLRIIANLYLPERGRVTVGGMDPAHARHLVAYLPQTTYLFAGSILENMRALSGGATLARLREVAAATGLAAVIDAWPMGYETRLQPGGGNLSGGQRQLVVLTACLASDKPILLLDEAFANLDRLLQARLRASGVFEGRTVVSVVHDPLPNGPGAEHVDSARTSQQYPDS